MSRLRMAGHRTGRLGELRHRLRHELRIAQLRIARQTVDLEQAASNRAGPDGDTRRPDRDRAPSSGTARCRPARRPRVCSRTAVPRRRLRTSSSMVLSKSSTSSSSISNSLLRVTRKTVSCSMRHAGKQFRQMHADDGFQRHEDVARLSAHRLGGRQRRTKRGRTPALARRQTAFRRARAAAGPRRG